MRKALIAWLVIVVFVGTFTSCGTSEGEIRKEYLVMLEEPSNIENIEKISEYLNKFLSKVDVDYASDMVVGYEDYILKYDNDGIDYKQWANRFEKHVNPALTRLYRIKAKEQESPMVKDTVLQITWEELVIRAYDMETFIHDFKDEKLIKEDAAWMFGNYINAMIMGTNGTPTFDYKTYKFSNKAKVTYAVFINKYPDTTIAWVLTEYFTYLDSINYTMDYNDKVSSKSFFDTCDWLVSEGGKRVFQ